MPRSAMWCAILCIASVLVVLGSVVLMVFADEAWLMITSAIVCLSCFVLSLRWFRRVEKLRYVRFGELESELEEVISREER